MKILLIILSACILSCSYTVYPSSYPHLKTITISQFENKTTEYELDDILFNELSSHFLQDGRLKIVGVAPDCRLEGEIIDYSNDIYKYSDTGVEEYEVKILFKVVLTDLVKNQIIFNRDGIILEENYSSDDENSEFRSEEEAQLEIIKDLFDLIIRDSLEAW